MPRYFLGLDIGDAKSHALLADENGRAVGLGRSGPGNYKVVGWEGLRKALQAITAQALSAAGVTREHISGAGLGIAGYDWPAERQPTRQAIESLGLEAPYEFVNHAIISLLAGTTAGWGVVVVAGASNNCRGLDRQGRQGRVTGCGSWFGEYGGAAELVVRAIQAVTRAWTRRGPATRLTGAFIASTGASGVTDLLEGLAMRRYRLSAADALTVFQVAAEGDAVAQQAVRWAGRELGSLAVGVIRQLDLEKAEPEVVLAGNLYDGGPILLDALRTTIHSVAPGARLVRLTVPPVVGGVLLGMQRAGLDYTPVRQTLIETTRDLT